MAYGDHLLRRQETRDDDNESGQKWVGSWNTLVESDEKINCLFGSAFYAKVCKILINWALDWFTYLFGVLKLAMCLL